MADLGGQYDANAKENNVKSVLPAGEYDVVCIKSERKATNSNDGAYLNCEFKITRGEYQNRSLFHKFNLWLAPSKQEAINIARGQFSEFCRAVGVLTPKDSSELHNRPLQVKLNVKESKDYGLQNNVVKFNAKQLSPVASPVQTAQAEPVPAAGSSGNPW